MSNPLFENPKVALGFSGVVVAVALVASVAFQEFSGSDEVPQEAVALAPASQAAPQQAQAGFAPSPAPGWGGASDDWGAPSASSQNGGFAEVPGLTNDAPVFGDHVSKKMDGGGADRSSGPKVTTSAAPGAPEVRPPETGFTPELQVKGN